MALPRRVYLRNRKASAVTAAANRKAMNRGLDRARPPITQAPVMNSTARRAEGHASWARFTSAIEIPKVSRSEDSSGASTTRKTSVRCRSTPTTNSAAIAMGTVRKGFIPARL